MFDIYQPTRVGCSDVCEYLDVHCFEHSWVTSEWDYMLSNPVNDVRLAGVSKYAPPIGFAAGQQTQHGYYLCKVGVLYKYRRMGVARHLVEEIITACLRRQGYDRILATVPEALVNPGKPNDCSRFLSKIGFKATRIVENDMLYLGQRCAAVYWERML